MAVNLFPHSVEDVTLLLHCFSSNLPEQVVWEVRFILLLWLLLLSKQPFDLNAWNSIDNTSVSTFDRIFGLGRQYLGCPGKERDAAARLLGELSSRYILSIFLIGFGKTQTILDQMLRLASAFKY